MTDNTIIGQNRLDGKAARLRCYPLQWVSWFLTLTLRSLTAGLIPSSGSRWCALLVCALFVTRIQPVGAQPTLVKDINLLPTSSVPDRLVAVGNVGYFAASHGVTGTELWRSNGTAAGTVLVKDILPGSDGSFSFLPAPFPRLTNVNGVLYFVTNNGVTGAELWRSNGTAAGTLLVKDILPGSVGSFPSGLTNVNGVLYFGVDDGVHGYELWRSNGTAAGTILFKDIWPGGGSSGASFPTNINGGLYFGADNGVQGAELWRSNGTAAGTILFKDILPGSGGSFPYALTNVNRVLYFVADDGVHGAELWRFDTTMIRNAEREAEEN